VTVDAAPRHKYVIVLGSCCSADAIRPKDLDDIRGANLRLLWYQGRTSLLSMGTEGLRPHEVAYKHEKHEETKVNWGLTMALDEAKKRQQSRLFEVIGMSDALVFDTVSGFGYPYLVVDPGERYFLQSEEWKRYVALRTSCERRRLWDLPMELSLASLRQLLAALYERQPELRVVFHLPRPCFNDGVTFEDPQLAGKVKFYHEYGERMYDAASRWFPRVSVVSCGGERADPGHYNGPSPFHYDESYMEALRKEIARLVM
jgi:Family of unknown function (DUF6270)